MKRRLKTRTNNNTGFNSASTNTVAAQHSGRTAIDATQHPGKQHYVQSNLNIVNIDIRFRSTTAKKLISFKTAQRAYSEESFDDFVRAKILAQSARVGLNALVHVPARARGKSKEAEKEKKR